MKTTKENGVETRKAILQYITEYIQLHGYSPSVREIGEGVGLKSSSSVQSHLQKMLKNGELETDAEFGTPRAIRVPGWKFVRENLILKSCHWSDEKMIMMQDGVRGDCLPDGAYCMADEEKKNPLELDECPVGFDECNGGCIYYVEENL